MERRGTRVAERTENRSDRAVVQKGRGCPDANKCDKLLDSPRVSSCPKKRPFLAGLPLRRGPQTACLACLASAGSTAVGLNEAAEGAQVRQLAPTQASLMEISLRDLISARARVLVQSSAPRAQTWL
jgi:hypothetical protein